MVKEIPGGALKSSTYPRSLLLYLTTLGVMKGRLIYMGELDNYYFEKATGSQ